MSKNKHAIILFTKDNNNSLYGVSEFPFTPEEIWDKGYSFNFINYIGDASPDTSVMDAQAKYVHVPFSDIKNTNQIMDLVATAIHAEDMQDKLIYSVHPNSILLPLYRWFLIKSGMDSSYIDICMQKLSRRVIDICEAFYKPTILSLERRQSFNCNNISFWFDDKVNTDTGGKDRCLNVIKYLCHRL